MLASLRAKGTLLLPTLGGALLSLATPVASDPCVTIANKTFVAAADAIACQQSFPFNETLRQNVIAVVSGVFDFYTFEDFYLDSPPPFQESTIDIRAELAKLNTSDFASDYEFNIALWNFTTQLNDGHTRWFPNCYNSYQNLLPAPVAILEEDGVTSVYVIPDLVELLTLLGDDFINFFKTEIPFDWQRLAGAKVTEIAGMDPFDYIDTIATQVSGNYLDHEVRVNSVVSSYRIVDTDFSQRVGDLAGPEVLTQTSLSMKLILPNSTSEESVTVPFVSNFIGVPFTDGASFWANNCAATDATNGVDRRDSSETSGRRQKLQPIAALKAPLPKTGVGLPGPFLPTLPPVNGSEGVIKSFILPDNKTGVMFVGSFEPDDFDGFQSDTAATITQFQESGVENLLIDLTNNGGGFVCLGLFLHQYLAGLDFGFPGFQSTNRANPLAQKIVANDIALGVTDQLAFYPADNWQFLNGTAMEPTDNYMSPSDPFTVNGKSDPTSQRFEDICTPYSVDVPAGPAFDFSKIAIVGNANCASTCSLFSTVMFERHNTSIAIFGGRPGSQIEYKGMAGNQVLEWADLDSEIKTAGLKDDPLAPPDLLVSSNMRHNWRVAWSFFDESVPIAYESEPAPTRFAYTKDTYNNPQNLWTFAAKHFFG